MSNKSGFLTRTSLWGWLSNRLCRSLTRRAHTTGKRHESAALFVGSSGTPLTVPTLPAGPWPAGRAVSGMPSQVSASLGAVSEPNPWEYAPRTLLAESLIQLCCYMSKGSCKPWGGYEVKGFGVPTSDFLGGPGIFLLCSISNGSLLDLLVSR